MSPAAVRPDVTDDRFTRVPLAEWERLRSAFASYCSGEFDATGDRLACRRGSAAFTVHRDGTVDAGMPLHEFTREGVTELGFDADAGEILVLAPDTRYVFRHPGR
jgi:hypothetical protein